MSFFFWKKYIYSIKKKFVHCFEAYWLVKIHSNKKNYITDSSSSTNSTSVDRFVANMKFINSIVDKKKIEGWGWAKGIMNQATVWPTNGSKSILIYLSIQSSVRPSSRFASLHSIGNYLVFVNEYIKRAWYWKLLQ